MILYMKVTDDKYELPIAVADSAPELARMVGTSVNSVFSSIAHKRKTYLRLDIPDDIDIEKELF